MRGRATLEPAGGPGDKVFPPSHSVEKTEKRPGAKYAFETRRLPQGEVVECVLLDSVQSQANRMEEALQALWDAKKITLPVITIDFSKVAPDVGMVTSLSAPHRIADALLRDSLLDGTLFRLTDTGRSFTDASIRDAAPLFRVCPTGLVFGLWDSTGPKGGLGAKFARALTSEIVGIGVERGVKTESRIDPAGIVRAAGPLYIKKRKGDEALTWTHDAAEAELDKGAPVLWGSKVKDGKWKPAENAGTPAKANHGNIPPSIEVVAGGVTIDRAEQTVVISLAGLRRLAFGTEEDSVVARTVLAALSILAVVAAEHRGHDLRSRCLLVPRVGQALALEAVARDGSTTAIALDLDGAISLYQAAVAALPKGLAFDKPPGEALVKLEPSPKLAHLIKESRKLAAAGADAEES